MASLHGQRDYYRLQCDVYADELQYLLNYVTSDKFTGEDTTVQAGDIVLRIREIQRHITGMGEV
jgi:hypothetical protein